MPLLCVSTGAQRVHTHTHNFGYIALTDPYSEECCEICADVCEEHWRTPTRAPVGPEHGLPPRTLSRLSLWHVSSLDRYISRRFFLFVCFPTEPVTVFKKHLPSNLSAPVRQNSRTLKKTPPTCNERVTAYLIVGKDLEKGVRRVFFSVCRELKKHLISSISSIFRSKQERSPLQTVICPPRPPYLTQYCGCQALVIDQRRKKLFQKASSPPSLSHCHCRGSLL